MSRVTDQRLAALIADNVPPEGDEEARALWHSLLDLRDVRRAYKSLREQISATLDNAEETGE